MSDTVKVIIEIPKDRYTDILRIADVQIVRRMPTLEQVVAHGIPLDDVKAEIDQLPDLNPDYPMDKTIHISKWSVMQILASIGKAESIDPNDLTHIFDGVTEIPKDAFKGWTTEKLLEQIRKENNDNPEDTGCDHNN